VSGLETQGTIRRNRTGQAAAIGLTLVLAGLAVAAVASRRAARRLAGRRRGGFSSFIDDLPIMPGLCEEDEGYAFDLYGGGRLAEARLAGDAEVPVIRGFYAATLAQLGWRASDSEPYVYHRAGERMLFLVETRRRARGAGRALQAIFVVSPAPVEAG
jgi:hypothetical protein